MVVTWVSLLKTVPWADVIANAPAITDGAKKLWNTVARKSPPGSGAEGPATGARPADAADGPSQAEAVAQLEARLHAVNATVSDLQGQMLASTELLRALADQNSELIARVEVHRRRLLWLSGGVAALVVLLAGQLLLTYQA
jgi:hypothetical protein